MSKNYSLMVKQITHVIVNHLTLANIPKLFSSDYIIIIVN